MTFEEFCRIVSKGIEKGELIVSKQLTELDLAIQYALGEEMLIKGKPLTVTTSEIIELIKKYCGKEVYNRVLGDGIEEEL